jgi:hypothetical protein
MLDITRIKSKVRLLTCFTQDLPRRSFLILATDRDQCLPPHRTSHPDTITTSHQYPPQHLHQTPFMMPESHKPLRPDQVVACR